MWIPRSNKKALAMLISGFILMLLGAITATLASFVPIWMPVIIAIIGLLLVLIVLPF